MKSRISTNTNRFFEIRQGDAWVYAEFDGEYVSIYGYCRPLMTPCQCRKLATWLEDRAFEMERKKGDGK
jgi:hypothetical protein